VVVSLVAGAVGFAHFDKSVTLSVDGKSSAVHLFGSTVGDVLTHQGIKLASHDLVAPAVSSPLQNNEKVVVRYGRLLTVDHRVRCPCRARYTCRLRQALGLT
jgi:uncharacterized protein YabE (DUF348 family)